MFYKPTFYKSVFYKPMVLQIYLLQIHVLQINLLQIHVLQIQSMFYRPNPVQYSTTTPFLRYTVECCKSRPVESYDTFSDLRDNHRRVWSKRNNDPFVGLS